MNFSGTNLNNRINPTRR